MSFPRNLSDIVLTQCKLCCLLLLISPWRSWMITFKSPEIHDARWVVFVPLVLQQGNPMDLGHAIGIGHSAYLADCCPRTISTRKCSYVKRNVAMSKNSLVIKGINWQKCNTKVLALFAFSDFSGLLFYYGSPMTSLCPRSLMFSHKIPSL